jgi:hypothetical protein
VQFLVSYPDTTLMNELSLIRDAAQEVALPFRIAETNSYFNGGSPNVSNSYASALWVIDHLFTLAANGCSGANLHGGGNSTGYTPIADTNGNVVGPRPEYYGIYFFTLAGEGELHPCQCDSAGLDLSAYAIETRSGGLNVMVVNKEPNSLSIALDLTGLTRGKFLESASITLMINTSLSATAGTTIGGSAINVDGGIASHESEKYPVANGHLRYSLPPISAALLKLN